MAHAYYNLQWQQAMEELSDVLAMENPPQAVDAATGKPLPEKPLTWNAAARHYTLLYLQYLQIFRKLEACHDQIVHPQKRRDIRVTLDAVMARVVQLKAQLCVFGPGGRQSDFPNFDGYLAGLRLSPLDLEVPIPRYFKERRPEDEAEVERRAILAKCLDEQGVAGPDAAGAGAGGADGVSAQPASLSNPSGLPLAGGMTRERAVALIQQAERARQAVARVRLLRELRDDDAIRARMDSAAALDPHAAAVVIQRAVRGFLSRVRTRAEAAEELVFLGMRPAPAANNAGAGAGAGAAAYDPIAKEAQVRRARKARQADHEVLYGEALAELEQQVTLAAGPELRDAMWRERYEWWLAEKARTGKAPKTLAGYYAMVAERDRPPEAPEVVAAREAEAAKKAEEARRAKRGGATAAASTRTGGRAGGKKKEDEAVSKAVTLAGSELVAPLTETVLRYREQWASRDESRNDAQTHDEDVARAALLPEVSKRIEAEVDVQLLGYLENVQAALAAQRPKKKKGKGGKKGDKGDKTATKKKAPADGTAAKKKSPGKRRKWLEGEKACAHMTLQDMVAALVKLNILQDNTSTGTSTMAGFVGGIHYVGSAYQAAGVPTDPAPAQLRQTLTELFVLPLGSPYVKAHAPPRSSLLLYGPRGSGKSTLARAIAAEARAVWLDLSPANVEAKLGSKAEIQKLLFLVFHVAKQLQPAVVFVDDAERVWAAGKGKAGKSKRKNNSALGRMRASLTAQRNALAPTDRVLVVGNSREPFAARTDVPELIRFFGHQYKGKMIYCPCPGYGARLELWGHLLAQAGLSPAVLAQCPRFDLSALAFVTEGFAAGSMQQAVAAALPPRRVEKILATGFGPASSAGAGAGGLGGGFDLFGELLRALSRTPYTYREEYVAFANFTFLATGERERLRLMQVAAAKEEEAHAAAAKSRGLRRKPA